jgi:hypothetical protein
MVVDTVNGVKITRMEDLPEALKNPINGYIVITLDGGGAPVVLSARDAAASHKRILESYGIPSDRELN